MPRLPHLEIQKMMMKSLIVLFSTCTIFSAVNAQFGIPKQEAPPSDPPTLQSLSQEDPELYEAMQMFAGMTPEERMETMEELKVVLGDDPELLKELDTIMEEIANMDPMEMDQSLQDLQSDVVNDALDLLAKADENDWDKVVANQQAILEAVIQNGGMSEEEAKIFRNDPDAWQEELRLIFEELKELGLENEHNSGEIRSDEL